MTALCACDGSGAHLPLHVLQQITLSSSEIGVKELNLFNQVCPCQRTMIDFGQFPEAIYKTTRHSSLCRVPV